MNAGEGDWDANAKLVLAGIARLEEAQKQIIVRLTHLESMNAQTHERIAFRDQEANELRAKIKLQSDRIGTLETFKTQAVTIFLVIQGIITILIMLKK